MTTRTVTALRRPSAAGRGGSIGVWLRTYLHWWRLDGELAAGAAATTPELRLRAAQLTSPRFRARLADSLDAALDAARRPYPRLSAQVPLNAQAVLDSEGVMRGLSGLLRDHDDSARAVAIVNRLLRDGAGPLFEPAAADLLEYDLRFARDLLREVAQ
jgi:hypothetical protein